MEKKFNTDNFEQLLRETTDEFRMYPSRRTWHSIYNDLHPARKWPSIAILLLLITSLMYVGVTNSNEAVAGKTSENNTAPVLVSLSDKSKATIPASFNTVNQAATSFHPQATASSLNADGTDISVLPEKHSYDAVSRGKMTLTQQQAGLSEDETSAPQTQDVAINSIYNDITVPLTRNSALSDLALYSHNVKQPSGIKVAKRMTAAEISAREKPTPVDKAWIEDFVLHNKKTPGKFRNRLAYQVYVTPSVGYRSYKKNNDFSLPNTATFITSPGQAGSMEYSLNHTSSLNLEGGTSVIYSYSKNLRIKAGFQLNYTNYRINAFALNHPSFTTLLLNDPNGEPVLATRSTTLANTPGPFSRNLNNNTYQLSLPVGADYRIFGSDKFNWYAGATLQPTYITGGHAYLISADLKNYVTEKTMLRTFNLNGGVETFVSFKTNNGVVLSAGPQFRYQLLSTYSKEYSYDEKLYNLGVKLGITRNF